MISKKILEYLNISDLPIEEQKPFEAWLRYDYGRYLQAEYEAWKANPDKIRRECGKGWFHLIDECEKELVALDVENTHWLQIKEKFGKLRLYFTTEHLPDDVAERANEIAAEYELKSYSVCEYCGNKGISMSYDGSLTTICKDCNHQQFAGKFRPEKQ